MTKRVVVNVADKPFRAGQDRLKAELDRMGECGWYWSYMPEDTVDHEGNVVSKGWPKHSEVPYAFKSCALAAAADRGFETLLWCDSSIVPIKPLDPLWERIEADGYFVSENPGHYTNYEWTADSAYVDLFNDAIPDIDLQRSLNKRIPHVAATAFGISLRHEVGCELLSEFHRLATETRAFCGPWINGNHYEGISGVGANPRCYPCGPHDVRGSRHDQTALSVLAWRLGIKLAPSPGIFAYYEDSRPETILLAKGI